MTELNKDDLGCWDCVNHGACPVIDAHRVEDSAISKDILINFVDIHGDCEMYLSKDEFRCDCPEPRPDLRESQFTPRELIDAYMRQFDVEFLEAAERVEWVGAWLYRELRQWG
jgi:hypothetical protein